MKICIVGGSGFIGRHIVEQLGTVYDIEAPAHAELDLQEKDEVVSYLEKIAPEIVIFSVNIGGKRNQNNQNILQNNLNMFFNVVAAKKYYGRMIVLGSGAEYDKRRSIIKIEEGLFGENVPVDEYGFGKYVMASFASQVDYITHLRLFGVYGKYEDYNVRFISNALCKKILGLPITLNRNVFFDYLYIKDLVAILRFFIEKRPSEVCYNVGTGKPIDLYTLAHIVNQVDGSPGEIQVLRDGLNNEYTCNTDRLREYIGDFSFTSYEQAIKEMYEYYLSVKHTLNRESFLQNI